MTLYDVLGVRPSASPDELRAAYLRAARRAHPDVAGPAGEDAMRQVNSAWSVLSDPAKREAYDLTLPAGPGQPGRSGGVTAGAAGSTARVSRPNATPFVPFYAVDEDDDDEWRYTDDATDPATAPGALLQLAPVVVVVLGLVVTFGGGIVGGFRVAVLGLALVAIGMLGFLFLPLAVMAKAGQVERSRDAQRRSSQRSPQRSPQRQPQRSPQRRAGGRRRR